MVFIVVHIRYLFVFLLLLVSCSQREGPEYLTYVQEVSHQFVPEVEKKYGLYCYGSGGSMPYDVAELEYMFISYHETNIEEARKLIVSLTQRLVDIVNQHEKIRPFLREYPFPYTRVSISVYFKDKKTRKYPGYGSLVNVFHFSDKVLYKKYDTDEFVLIKEESYREALKKVQGENG